GRLAGTEPYPECAPSIRSAAGRRDRGAGREQSVGNVPFVRAWYTDASRVARKLYAVFLTWQPTSDIRTSGGLGSQSLYTGNPSRLPVPVRARLGHQCRHCLQLLAPVYSASCRHEATLSVRTWHVTSRTLGMRGGSAD